MHRNQSFSKDQSSSQEKASITSVPVFLSSWRSWHPTHSRPSCDRGISWYAPPLSCRRARTRQAARRCHGTRCLAWSPGRAPASRWSYTSTPGDRPRIFHLGRQWRNLSRRQSILQICSVSCFVCSAGLTSSEKIFVSVDENYNKSCSGTRLDNTVVDHWS